MNFSKQLKKYREQHQLSQEALAEKLYVTRQTISKWENDKTYPDIHNLIALSVLFDISLDELVKGDMNEMKKRVQDNKMNDYTKGMLLFLALTLIIGVPSIMIEGKRGYIPFAILWIISMYFAMKVEKIKKDHDIKTYKEIIAFSEGAADLDDLRKNRNQKKAIKEKIIIVLAFSFIMGVFALIIALATDFLNHLF